MFRHKHALGTYVDKTHITMSSLAEPLDFRILYLAC